MNIILVGYMGSGKSTIGAKLAKKINRRFIDLDNYIEIAEKKEINEIFAVSGDIYFRKKESLYLESIISKSDNIVLSLGGGTICYNNNVDLIKNFKNISFYLKLNATKLSERLYNIKSKRPLLSSIDNENNLLEYISKHLFERESYYRKSDHIIDCNDKSIDNIIDCILDKLD
tara:strand:- start:191 stop:709 length:519 start_codon:yes stop_codon:yes gene_type:complete